MQVNKFISIVRFSAPVDKISTASRIAIIKNNKFVERCLFKLLPRMETEALFKNAPGLPKEPLDLTSSRIQVSADQHRGRNNKIGTCFLTSSSSNSSTSSFPFILSGIMAWLGLQEKEEEDPESQLITTMKRGILAARNEDLEKANQMFHIALRMAIDLGHEEAQTHIYCLLANCAMEQGMYMQAERLFTTVLQRILAAGTKQDSNAVVEISLKLASIFVKHGDTKKAEHGFNFCLEAMNNKMKDLDSKGEKNTPVAEDGPSTSPVAKENSSNEVQTSTEETDESVKYEPEEETVEDTIALWGMTLDQRGQFCMSQGKLSEAKDMFTKAVGVSLRLHGPDHEQTLVITNSIATVFCMEGKHQEAVVLLNKVVDKARQIESEHLATFLVNLGMTKLRQGLAVEARKSCGEGLELARKIQDEDAIEQGQKCLIEVNT